jgi:hypothetical protein
MDVQKLKEHTQERTKELEDTKQSIEKHVSVLSEAIAKGKTDVDILINISFSHVACMHLCDGRTNQLGVGT